MTTLEALRHVIVLLVQFVASIAVTAWIVRTDIRRLPPAERERAWPDASIWAAAFWFSPLCLLIHFVRTRRSLAGAGLGLLWLSGALLAIQASTWLVDTILGG